MQHHQTFTVPPGGSQQETDKQQERTRARLCGIVWKSLGFLVGDHHYSKVAVEVAAPAEKTVWTIDLRFYPLPRRRWRHQVDRDRVAQELLHLILVLQLLHLAPAV